MPYPVTNARSHGLRVKKVPSVGAGGTFYRKDRVLCDFLNRMPARCFYPLKGERSPFFFRRLFKSCDGHQHPTDEKGNTA